MADGEGVLVFSESNEIAFELLAKGRELADAVNGPLMAASFGAASAENAAKLSHYGADKIFTVADSKLDTFIVENYTDALEAVISTANPKIVMIGQTKQGGELAPRLAARLKTGCAVGCTKFELTGEGNLQIERIVMGGNATAVEVFNTVPQVATVLPKTFEPMQPDESRTGESVAVDADIKDVAKAVLKSETGECANVRLEDAAVIISGGRGFKKKEDFELIKGLASALNGEMGCSRPIAADLKWLSEDHWVGLSGHKVKPKLYIACGISGQIQHLAGMRDSNIIIAINKDPDAPIFNAVDYGLVGDIYQIIPKLTEELKKG
ncbi:MAG: electron transfer flavoprotein subunit alpha/FixB family protein [Thermoplasmata archaeon]|nr:MAG: electron transfer flavoprotein subunit alpha/FixB family protein [Thermoplasmata archaeon]